MGADPAGLPVSRPRTPDDFDGISKGRFPGLVGIKIVAAEPRSVDAEIEVGEHHLAPNGFLHAGAVVTLADTACGYGCVVTLPEGATGFTTAELKSNFVGTTTSGRIVCRARCVHAGRSTQVWDAEVADWDGRIIALFRCTQMVLWPRPAERDTGARG